MAMVQIVVSGSETAHVALAGELDIADADELFSTLVAVAGSTVVVDLSAVEFIDAAGLGSLLRARNVLAAEGHSLAFVNVPSRIRRVFVIAGLGVLLDDVT